MCYTSDQILLHSTSLMVGLLAIEGRPEAHIQACKKWRLSGRTHGSKIMQPCTKQPVSKWFSDCDGIQLREWPSIYHI